MSKYSIVFTDLDGTVFKKDKSISERTIRSIRMIREKGALWVVASARPERAISIYDEIREADALITLNGARIKLHDKIISNGFSRDDAHKILDVLKDRDDLIVTIESSEGIHGTVEIPEWNTPKADDLKSLFDRADIYKILVSGRSHQLSTIRDDSNRFCDTDEVEKIVKESIEYQGLSDRAYYSVAEGWLFQIMSRNATKWQGVDLVLKTERIDPQEAVYFGDDNDDIESISNVGLGIAMGNAIDKVKAVADEVTLTNEEDGVAVMLEKLF